MWAIGFEYDTQSRIRDGGYRMNEIHDGVVQSHFVPRMGDNWRTRAVLRVFVVTFALFFILLTIATYRFVYSTGPRAMASASSNEQRRDAIDREMGTARFIVGPALIILVYAHYRAAFHASFRALVIVLSFAGLAIMFSITGLFAIAAPAGESFVIIIPGCVGGFYLVVMLLWFWSERRG